MPKDKLNFLHDSGIDPPFSLIILVTVKWVSQQLLITQTKSKPPQQLYMLQRKEKGSYTVS